MTEDKVENPDIEVTDTPPETVAVTKPKAPPKPKTESKGGYWWGTGRRKSSVARVRIKPGSGKLDFPGGFIDPNETAEEALRREIKEELGINLGVLKYIGSYPNIYDYKKVRYYTCDIFFHCRIDSVPTSIDKTEIAELVLVNPLEVQEEEIAFESTKVGLGLFINTQNTM